MIEIPIWLFVLLIIACFPWVLLLLLVTIAFTSNLIERIITKFEK